MKQNQFITKTSNVQTTAVFSDDGKNRFVLKMEWDLEKPKLAIIMTYPSTADEFILDQTTMLVRNSAYKNNYGSVSIVNVFSSTDNNSLRANKINNSMVLDECANADDIIVAYGRGTSHVEEKERFLEMLNLYKDKLYTIIDSKGLKFSHPLSPLAHNWDIKKLY